MTSACERLLQLADADRRLLESWLVEFDQAWQAGQLAAWVRRLPSPGSVLRLPALVELVKIDLERHWEQGSRVALEVYLKDYPELGTPESVLPDLLQVEFEVRRQQEERANQKATEARQEQQRADQKATEAEASARRADQEAARVKEEKDKFERHLYVAHMNLAQRAWEENGIARLRELLDGQRPDRTGGKDLRGWEGITFSVSATPRCSHSSAPMGTALVGAWRSARVASSWLRTGVMR